MLIGLCKWERRGARRGARMRGAGPENNVWGQRTWPPVPRDSRRGSHVGWPARIDPGREGTVQASPVPGTEPARYRSARENGTLCRWNWTPATQTTASQTTNTHEQLHWHNKITCG